MSDNLKIKVNTVFWNDLTFVFIIIFIMESSKYHFALTDSHSAESQVTEAYRDLNKAIDEMDHKVEHVIKKHEAEFLYAYRNHIAKIKK